MVSSIFGKVFHEMSVPLPPPSSLVYSVPSLLWIALALIMAVLLIVRDTSGKKALFPNWVALLILLISGVILYIALFMPMFPLTPYAFCTKPKIHSGGLHQPSVSRGTAVEFKR